MLQTCDYLRASVGLVAPRHRSCRMSAVRPREFGWNILHLKWPYFRQWHTMKRSSTVCVQDKCRLKNRAEKRWDGSQPGNVLGVRAALLTEILEAPPANCDPFFSLNSPLLISCKERPVSRAVHTLIPKTVFSDGGGRSQSHQHSLGVCSWLSTPYPYKMKILKVPFKKKLMKS